MVVTDWVGISSDVRDYMVYVVIKVQETQVTGD